MYLLMDFATGGELFYHLRGRGRFDEDTARFYAAEVILALEYMHSNNIAFRDLKLEKYAGGYYRQQKINATLV